MTTQRQTRAKTRNWNKAQVKFIGAIAERMLKGKEKVPKRLLTKEMIAWQRQYKQTRKIAKASEMAGFGFEDVLRQSLFEMKNLLENIPRSHIKELAQQPAAENEGEEE